MSTISRRALGCLLSVLIVLTGVNVAFPQDPNDVDIELYYNGTWNNIDAYVYHRDAAPIVITRGRANEGRNCDPGRMTLTINNRDGRFSPRNPNSPLFGKIGRNTPIRIKVTYDAVTYTRFMGEVASWPARWDVSETDVWVPIEAAGILRRLGQGEKPIRSPLFAATAGLESGDFAPVAYLPMEDSADAAQFASGLAGAGPGAYGGTVDFGADAELAGSHPLPTFEAGASLTMTVPTYVSTGIWGVQFLAKVPSEPGSTTTIAEVFTNGEGTNSSYRVKVVPGSPTTLQLFAVSTAVGSETLAVTLTLDGSGTPSQPTEATFYGHWWLFKVGEEITAGNLVGELGISDGSPVELGMIGGGGGGGATSTVRSVKLYAETAVAGIAFGHVAAFVDATMIVTTELGANAQAMHGWPGEEALDRFVRICAQENLPATTIGASSAPMGPQRIVALLDSVRECEATDQGILFEQREDLGLALRSNSSKYHQIAIALDYDVGHISPPFDPEPDDANVANDREVKRRGGSSARRELTSGPLSIQDPPDGIGRYDDSITVDAYDDDQLPHIANWRLHIGTWDAERYPRVRVDLAANPDLIADIAVLDSGDLVTISNLPSWLPPEDAELIVEGYRETIGFYTWDFVFNCSPAGPYNVVGVWEMTAELHTAMNTSVTSADIATTAGPLLATSGIGSGYGIKIGGEEMQVTAVAASTITYGAVGTVAHANNANVTPALPASVASGNLLLCYAAIRNSGTGVPQAPTGYTRLAVFPTSSNAQVFGKIAGGSETDPTVTFTGGAANADTSAQIIRLAGKWHDIDNVLLSAASCLNTSAQNVTYPGLSLPAADNCIVVYFGWKQDDWTSVTGPGTEIAEEDTTTGDDQGIVWAYTIQTTAAAIASGVFTVTGGASAISRGAVCALRSDYQVATVTRSTNGVSASHSAADSVALTRPMRWAL